MSLKIPKAEGHEKLVANMFGVETQDIPITTRTRLLHQNYVATLSKSIATKSKKELKNQVATENSRLRQRPATKTENSIVIESLCCNRVTNLGQNFGDPQRNIEVRPNIFRLSIDAYTASTTLGFLGS